MAKAEPIPGLGICLVSHCRYCHARGGITTVIFPVDKDDQDRATGKCSCCLMQQTLTFDGCKCSVCTPNSAAAARPAAAPQPLQGLETICTHCGTKRPQGHRFCPACRLDNIGRPADQGAYNFGWPQ